MWVLSLSCYCVCVIGCLRKEESAICTEKKRRVVEDLVSLYFIIRLSVSTT